MDRERYNETLFLPTRWCSGRKKEQSQVFFDWGRINRISERDEIQCTQELIDNLKTRRFLTIYVWKNGLSCWRGCREMWKYSFITNSGQYLFLGVSLGLYNSRNVRLFNEIFVFRTPTRRKPSEKFVGPRQITKVKSNGK